RYRRAPNTVSRRRLVAQARQAFAFPQHGQDIENAGGSGPPGQSRPQRLRHGAELAPRRIAKAAHALLKSGSSPWFDVFKRGDKGPDHASRFGAEQSRGLVVERDRTIGVDVTGALDEFDQGLGPLLEGRHGGNEL